MFVKDRYIVILLCLFECYIGQHTGRTAKKVRHRSKLEEKRPVNSTSNTFVVSAHQNLVKENEENDKTTQKWPKILRHGKSNKQSTRVTILQMKQDDDDDAMEEAEPLENTESKNERFNSYNIRNQLAKMMTKIPKLNITLEVIGRTLEYQDIVMLRISELPEIKFFRADVHKYAEEVPEKKIIFIVHGLSIMGVQNLPCLTNLAAFRKLLSYYTSHLNKFDIFLIPMANPDGYSYVQSQRVQFSSIWNKNVSPQSDCPGVALDRNFEVAWENNRSISSCSQEYPGTVPFSEAETRAVRDIFHKYAHKIIAYFHVHPVSFDSSVFKGDAVLYPKGFNDNTVDDDKYIDLRSEIDEAIRNASFQVLSVTVETLYNWYGRVTGTSVDYASTVNHYYELTIELARNSYIVNLYAAEVGARGITANSIHYLLKDLGLSRAFVSSFPERTSKTALIYGIPFAMELVMQHYDDTDENSESEDYKDLALTGVWKRVIDVIFSFIWKSCHGNEAR